MHVLHYLDEIRPMDEIKEISQMTSEKAKPDEQEMALGKTLVEQLTSQELDLGKYSDTYSQKVEDLIDAKSKGKEVITAPESVQESTTDLLAALKASISTKTRSPKKEKRL